MNPGLNSEQADALEILNRSQNVFLTGRAGTGKSHLIHYFQKQLASARIPIVASTGAAAVLVKGRTFHSFFGLGIMAGGVQATVEKACRSDRVKKRIQEIDGVVIDEVSMLSGITLSAAEQISRKIRGSSTPWGGLKVIVVGDFFQLPPVTRSDQPRDWVFRHSVWTDSEFQTVALNQVMRTQDADFLNALNEVRIAQISEETDDFFRSRISLDPNDEFVGTRLYPRNAQADGFNQKKLHELKDPLFEFHTEYSARLKEDIERAKPYFSFPEILPVRKGAFVMLTNNDPAWQWHNGTTGHVREISPSEITVEKLNGKTVEVKPITLEYLGPNGEILVTARNFPMRLGYAVTIHKAQGMTLDRLRTDLSGAWEHGQAYVALSRVKSSEGLSLRNWSRGSVVVDPEVIQFYRNQEAF